MIRIKKNKTQETLGRLAEAYIGLNIATQGLSSMINRVDYDKYEEKKYMKFNELKGGKKIMETKSRYEVIAELEEKKRALILDRDALKDNLKIKKRNLRDIKRDLEDEEEKVKEYEDSMDEQKTTINELIKSVDESLNRFAKLSEKKSQSQKK